MKHFCFLLFLSFIFGNSPSLAYSRTDYVSESYVAANMGTIPGTWQYTIECDPQTWAAGYRAWINSAYLGIVMLQLYCYDWKGNYVSQTSEFITDTRITIYGGWQSTQTCSLLSYYTKHKLFGCCCGHVNDLGLNNMKLTCSDGTEKQAGSDFSDGDKHGWNALSSCPAGTAICGFQAKFESWDDSTFADNTALNDFKMECCRICNPKSSVYPSGSSCLSCDMNCLTCKTTSTTCDTCGGTDTLSSSTCVPDSKLLKISEEFKSSGSFATDFSSGGWVGTSTSASCGTLGTFLGFFGSATSQTKTVTNLVAHYKARIKGRFYKINSWSTSTGVTISVGGTALTISKLSNWANTDSLYYGDQCTGGSGSGNEDQTFIDEEFLHTSTSIVITLTSNAASNTFWGFSHFGLYIYRCDSTCKTCSNSAADKCLSCYPHATQTATGTCVCDNPYYPETTVNCIMTTGDCTVCTHCQTGCASCTGGTVTDCLTCETNYYFYLGEVTYPPSSSFLHSFDYF